MAHSYPKFLCYKIYYILEANCFILLLFSGSSATMVNCVYINNYIFGHMEVIQASLTLYNSQFINNTGNFWYFAEVMFHVSESKVTISGCTFENNIAPAKYMVYTSMFSLADSKINITNTVFEGNKADILILAKSFTKIPSQYIQIGK